MMSKKWLMGILALAVLLAVVGGRLLFTKMPVEPTGEDGRSLGKIITETKTSAQTKDSSAKRTPSASTGNAARGAGGAGGARDPEEDDDDEDTPEEKAVKHWEKTIAEFYEETEDADDGNGGGTGDAGGTTSTAAPNANVQPKEPRVTLDDQLRIRDAFREMTEVNRMFEIQHTMNLLPDESIEVIYGVLFDKTQPEDIMDIIFSDILNRDEAIKNPMMREIKKDKDHPMYPDAARILDVIDDEE